MGRPQAARAIPGENEIRIQIKAVAGSSAIWKSLAPSRPPDEGAFRPKVMTEFLPYFGRIDSPSQIRQKCAWVKNISI
jgi:hypothetical protein